MDKKFEKKPSKKTSEPEERARRRVNAEVFNTTPIQRHSPQTFGQQRKSPNTSLATGRTVRQVQEEAELDFSFDDDDDKTLENIAVGDLESLESLHTIPSYHRAK